MKKEQKKECTGNRPMRAAYFALACVIIALSMVVAAIISTA